MAKGAASSPSWDWQARRPPVNTGDRGRRSGGRGGGAATGEPDQAAPVGDRRSCTSVRRSGHLICDPALVLVAWRRVRGNKGARTAGVDGGQTARYIERERGEEAVLADVGAELKARRFTPLPVRERQIPKPGGKLRRLGIATIQDRVVQAALKLVLEPIFEADFVPCSYGFRIPVCGRRAFTKYAPGQRSARSGCGAGRLAGARDPPSTAKHRSRRMGEAPKAASSQPHDQVEHPIEGAGERVAGWIAEDQGAPCMVGGGAQQPRIVRIAAHHPVQDHQVGRRHRPGVLSEVVDAPVDPPLDTCLPGQRACLLLVGGGEFQVLGPGRARLQQLDLDLADAPADLQHAGALNAELAQDPTIVWAVWSRPRLRYRLASRRANRRLKKRR